MLLELGLRGFGVPETEGYSGCPSGRVFWDDLTSGRRTKTLGGSGVAKAIGWIE